MPYTAITSVVPPATGQSKMLFSPELFDEATGAYPKAPLPSVATYPPDAQGRLVFFDHAQLIAQAGIRLEVQGLEGQVTGPHGYIREFYVFGMRYTLRENNAGGAIVFQETLDLSGNPQGGGNISFLLGTNLAAGPLLGEGTYHLTVDQGVFVVESTSLDNPDNVTTNNYTALYSPVSQTINHGANETLVSVLAYH